MHPVYDCPLDIRLEDMKEYIEQYNTPALLITGDGKILARNSAASFKNVPIRIGANVKSLVPLADMQRFVTMNYGEIRNISMKTDRIVNAIVARFYKFFFLGWFPTRNGMAKSVLELNSEVTSGSFGMLGFCSALNENKPSEMLAMKQLVREQFCRQMNLGRMLEIVTDTNIKPQKQFSPHAVLSSVCEITGGILHKGNAIIKFKLENSIGACYGIEDDYCSATAAMVSFAVRNCKSGNVWAEASIKDTRYSFSVSFKSKASLQELLDVINETVPNNTQKSVQLKAELLYIRCIAENSFWGFDISQEANGNIKFTLLVPLNNADVFQFMQPTVHDRLRSIIEAQLVFIGKIAD